MLPGETKDVHAEHPEIVKRLKAELLAWHESMPPDAGATFRGRGGKRGR